MEYIEKITGFFFTKQCMKEYFTNFNFLHVECFKATLSKVLGTGIIAGSLTVKLPQVFKIYANKSSQGINFISVLLDLFAITAMGSYSYANGFPFSGETMKATAFFFGYMSVILGVITGMAPVNVLWACQNINIPIILLSKFFQARTNYNNSSTGQLSAVTCFMLFFGSLARIFTSMQETGDTSMIIMYICSTTANAVIAGQLLYYWNAGDKKTKKKVKSSKKQS
ncbi:Similar to CG3792: Mannose-P-dolichol utilization defect 1 protein homolog (Drosophila melanogaster) [Cotesia congregata]|uniref:Mannose-P-dolichol utilization defect 1 protein homolog n=1 Tax=Cotesia congregata TaxID=51543 RepID=A0A8J2MPG2_COTCN|nr:Similar to CG3792: Mannose-P-dolichol utilization defect 1 protein homolog (Drosophila melanogaster) [Cotesia congregata]